MTFYAASSIVTAKEAAKYYNILALLFPKNA